MHPLVIRPERPLGRERQQRAHVDNGDAAAARCGFQAFSPDAGLPHPLLVGVSAGETPGDVELRDEQVTGKFLSINVHF